MIRKLLVANRGEIACRVFRAAREASIATVAVYSEADASAIHTQLADEAVLIGPPEAALSYLDPVRIINAAREVGADAIHPGYGFLSERASFSEACRDAGITFLGPSPEAMHRLGSKVDAKTLAVKCGVPIVPGFFESGASQERLRVAATDLGYPIMLKASAGGGGRGMRVVRDPALFDSEFETASDEALKAFGDGTMMVEKFVERPRHIELQMLADQHGNVAALFERECSLQRRHQKLVEEAPSPHPTYAEHIWPRMRDAAMQLLREAEYVGAGTVEFMVDPESDEFYFLEVNARLQVEHPVTEAITGLDLVRWQIRITNGEPLNLGSEITDGVRSAIHGHAIEARIVAENPAVNFMPSTGKIKAWAAPQIPGVRVDTGYAKGSEVSQYYDSLLAKVIAHGETRSAALDRLRAALLDFHILGVQTNIGYLLDLIATDAFQSGHFDTGFIGRSFAEWQPPAFPEELGDLVVAASETSTKGPGAPTRSRSWDSLDAFRNVRG